MTGKTNKPEPHNALRGDREDIKAYLGLLGFDESTMTERHLSPKAVHEMRQTVAKTLAENNYDGGWGMIGNYPQNDRGSLAGTTHMQHVVGRVSPNNVRQVNIAGVPYYQVIDIYDFDAGAKQEGTWQNALLDGAMAVIKNPRAGLDPQSAGGGYLNYPYEAERFAGKLGLGRNLNYLIPVDPRRVAPEEALEAHRKKTNLPYKPQTLGNKVVRKAGQVFNALTPQTPYEKAQP